MKFRNLFITLMSGALLAMSCEPAAKEEPLDFSVTPSSLNFEAEGGTLTFTVKSNKIWTVKASNWITLSTKGENGSDVSVTVAATAGKNAEEIARSGEINVYFPSGESFTITASQDPFVAPKGIYSASDLQSFAQALATEEQDLSEWINEEDGVIYIYNDIDASALDCLPMETTPLSMIIDGQDHSISVNIESSESKIGLFKQLRGTVKNLNLNGSVKVVGAPEAEVHAAALAADAQNCILENVNNYANVSADVENTSKKCIITGGLIGKATVALSMTSCTNGGSHSFHSKAVSSGAYCMMGGLVGAFGGASTEGTITLKNCSNVGTISADSNDTGNWNYVGGIISNVQGISLPADNVYFYVADGCTASGDINLNGTAKYRGSGVAGRCNIANNIKNCSYSGTVNINAGSLERNVGGITSFQEKTCQGLIENCTFSGKIISENNPIGKPYLGGITSSGCSAATVFSGNKTTKDAYISHYSCSEAAITGNLSMIVAQSSDGTIVKDCKVAGTIVTAFEQVVISAENYADWMCMGYAGGKSNVSNCGYNAE